MQKRHWLAGGLATLCAAVALVPQGCGSQPSASTRSAAPRKSLAEPSPERVKKAVDSLRRAWWQPDYSRLVSSVREARGGSLTLEYLTAPRGEDYMRLTLTPVGASGLAVDSDAPPGAVFSVDEKTGKRYEHEERFRVELDDEDGDGVPDAVRYPPGTAEADPARTRPDGALELTGQPDEEGVYAMWYVFVAYSTNRILYGRDSVKPPE